MSCAAILCGALLLTSTAHAARTQSNASSVVEGYEGEGTDTAVLDTRFTEAAALAMALWVHNQVVECLENGPTLLDPAGWFHHRASRLNPAENRKKGDLVQKVWEHELNQYRQKIVKNSWFDSIKNKVLARASKGQELFEEEEHAASWKSTLDTKYHFDYDRIKKNCIVDVEVRINHTKDMVEAELSSGCAGSCSKRSLVSRGACQETSAATFCPEGTRCGCSVKRNDLLGTLVGTMAVASYAGITALIAGPVAALAIPGKVEVGMLTAILSSSTAEGCRCLPAPCKWSSPKKACAPAPTEGAKNPFQAVLPYVGMKCVARPLEKWRALAGLDPGCEMAMPCMPEDTGKVGQEGTDTFNCKYEEAASSGPPFKFGDMLDSLGFPLLDKGKSPRTLFPPLRERLQTYGRLYYDQT